MTHLVYPGALHTRFEHSLGVCYVAGRLAENLNLDEDDRRVVRAAALLHDIGHGPFSHVSEAVLDERNGISGVHEAISVAIIRTDEQLAAAFGTDLCNQAADLIGHTGDFAVRSVLRDIVSGPTDADKLDYLLRDSYFAGVHYGEYDLPRLLDTATRIGDDNDLETYLGFHSGGLWAVEGLLLARHHMHRQVYGHKVRVATDIMIQRALSLAIAEGIVGSEGFDVAVVDGKPAPDAGFLDAYLKLTDSTVMRRLLDQPTDTPSKDIATRLATRNLLRRSARIDFDDARSELGGPRIGRILDPERLAPQLPRLEQEIAKEICCPAHLVALRVEEPGNPVYRSPNSGIGSKDILLSFDDRPPDLMQTESEIFRNATEANQRFASLYAPKTQLPTDDRATKLLWDALKTL